MMGFFKESKRLILMNLSINRVLIRSIYTNNLFFDKKLPENVNSKKLKTYKAMYVKNIMSEIDPKIDEILDPLKQSVKEQGEIVRSLKGLNASETEVKEAVNELKARKQLLEEKAVSLAPINAGFDRVSLELMLKKRFFYQQSFGIYGGFGGQYDFGPMGCAMKTNIINYWRKHFVLEEQMLELDCTVLTPEPVLKASGHLNRFTDLMVRDIINGQSFRCDHLIKEWILSQLQDNKTSDEMRKEYKEVMIKLEEYSKDELNDILRKYEIKSPINGNPLTDVIEINLMFSTLVGPSGDSKAFLRPETAQGIFVNFRSLYEFNHKRLPFGAAQIGNAFRNEISPSSGLIRVREFTLAEIEHFLDPIDKTHPKFDSVKDMKVNLFSAYSQTNGLTAEEVSIEDAVNNKTIANQTLGYFIARIHLFLIKIGVDPKRLRFRQHKDKEIAHYAIDCWDAECLTSHGWIECVGCADRHSYDLTQHSNATNAKLVAERELLEPKQLDLLECIPIKTMISKTYKSYAKLINETFSSLDSEQVLKYENQLSINGEFIITIGEKNFKITKDMAFIKRSLKTMQTEEIIPGVIEPSFGISRIMYTILEHNFRIRDGARHRSYLTLPPIIAPLKCSVLPLGSNQEFKPYVKQISALLTDNEVSHKVDDSNSSIGRRYERIDQISIPFAITIDFDTLKVPNTATLRERDSMQQIRVPIEDLGLIVRQLSDGKKSWDQLKLIYPKFEQKESNDES